MRYKWKTCLLVISVVLSSTIAQDSLSGGVLELRMPTSVFQSDPADPSHEQLVTSESRRHYVTPQLSYAWFEQILDHSNETDSRHWLQRYFEYGGYYKPGGPIFIQIDAEGNGLPAPIDMTKKGSMVQYAKDHGAYIVALEHRFYGLSRPMPDLTQRSLQYLNVDQALDDIANFIAWFKVNSGFESNKIVLFGSSYGGTLAKWFQQTYPNMTDMIVTSSAPLEARYEMPDYLEKVSEIINRTSPQCLQDLTRGFDCLERAVQGEPCGEFHRYPPNIADLFNLCEDINPENELDVTGLFYTLFNVFNNVIVNNIPDPKLSVSLEGICQSLSFNASSFEVVSPLERLAKVVREVTQASDLACIEFSLDKIVRYLRETTWTSPAGINGDRQFEWQRCNELGWVRGSNEPQLPFGKRISSSFHMEVCKRTFGLSENMMKRAIDEVNKDFKGKTVETQCGIFIHGQNDPWNVLGATTDEDVGPCNRVVMIEGASHAKDKGAIQDLSSIAQSIPPGLKPAQREIGKILGTWLKQGNCCDSKLFVSETPTNWTLHGQSVSVSDSNPPSDSENSYGAVDETPSDPALLNSQQQSVSPFNEIDLSESKKVERKHPKPNLDNIEIQNGVPFREIEKFLKKHEDQFFTPDAQHNRYRVRIRKTDTDGQHNGNQTFSKFGIKIRMLQSAPEEDKQPNKKTVPWDNLPQWTRWTDFETKETINPNGTIIKLPKLTDEHKGRRQEKEEAVVGESHDSHELFRPLRHQTHQHRSSERRNNSQETEVLKESVHSLNNRFGKKNKDVTAEDKSLLVLKLRGEPKVIPLAAFHNATSSGNSTRIVKRVRVKHNHRSSRKKNETIEANKPLVQPTKRHEMKKIKDNSEQYVKSPEKTLAEFGVGSHEDTLFLNNKKQTIKPAPGALELWPPIREDPDDNSQVSKKEEEYKLKQGPRKITALSRLSHPTRGNGTHNRRKSHGRTSVENVKATSTTPTTTSKPTTAPITNWSRDLLNQKHQRLRNSTLNDKATLISSRRNKTNAPKNNPLVDADQDENPHNRNRHQTESPPLENGEGHENDQSQVSHPNKDHREIGSPDIFEEETPSEFERALAGEDLHRLSGKSRHRGNSHRSRGSKTSIKPNSTDTGSLTTSQVGKEPRSLSHQESHGNHSHQATGNHHHGNHTTTHGGRKHRHHNHQHGSLTNHSLVESDNNKLTTNNEGVSKVYVVKVKKRNKHPKDKNGTHSGDHSGRRVIHRELLLTRNNSNKSTSSNNNHTDNETLVISSSDYQIPHHDNTNPRKPWIIQLPPERNTPPRAHKSSFGQQRISYKRPASLQLLMMKDSKGNQFPIPQAALDWRNPKSPFVDMSVSPDNGKKGSLALTPEDVAWVNYGIPWRDQKQSPPSTSLQRNNNNNNGPI